MVAVTTLHCSVDGCLLYSFVYPSGQQIRFLPFGLVAFNGYWLVVQVFSGLGRVKLVLLHVEPAVLVDLKITLHVD